MKESSIIGGFGQLDAKLKQVIGYVQQLEQSIRLAFTGQEIRGASLQSLLISKGLLTKEEVEAEIGKTIQKMQAEADEAAKAQKSELIVPSTEQVQQVNNTPVDAVIPPTTPA